MPLLANLGTIVTLALLALSAVPVHAAAHGHAAIAKHKRDASSATCKPRPTSAATSTPAPSPTPSTPSPTSSTPSASAAPSPASDNTLQKFGLAWGTEDDYLPNFALPNVKFFHNWTPQIPTGQLSQYGIEGIPTLWGPGFVEEFQSTVVEGYARYAAFFNEPDQSGQANIGASDAVPFYRQYMNPLKDLGYTLISAACTDSPDGLQWYIDFFQECESQGGCQVDTLAVHCYNTNTAVIEDFLTNLHDTFGLPVMITEFADQDFSGNNQQPSTDEVTAFASNMTQLVRDTDWLIAAFPFGVMNPLAGGVNYNNALLTSDGQPTQLAYQYFG